MAHAKAEEFAGYGIYWRTWTALLVLTAIMFVVDRLQIPRTPFVLIMLTAMMTKVVLITGIFMHLKQESLELVIGIATCLLGCSVLLYGLIVVDAFRILAMN